MINAVLIFPLLLQSLGTIESFSLLLSSSQYFPEVELTNLLVVQLGCMYGVEAELNWQDY